MPRRGHTSEQIIAAIRQAEGGEKVAEVCRNLGISEAKFYSWKKQYAGVGLSELRELRQLPDENRKLKQLVADLTLDQHVLQKVVKKSFEAGRATLAGAVGPRGLPAE